MRVLNLYAGLGGNRDKWKDCEVTAVEFNQSIADFYQKRFPNDKVFVADAHAFLLAHYKEFDFIWSSPPCQTHSRVRFMGCEKTRRIGAYSAVFPDLNLYQEIIFLKHYFRGVWIVENVKPYYKPLIEPTARINRHFFWSNLPIESRKFKEKEKEVTRVTGADTRFNFSLKGVKILNHRRDQTLHNLVNPDVGAYILELARRSK